MKTQRKATCNEHHHTAQMCEWKKTGIQTEAKTMQDACNTNFLSAKQNERALAKALQAMGMREVVTDQRIKLECWKEAADHAAKHSLGHPFGEGPSQTDFADFGLKMNSPDGPDP
eukprot:1280062-Amphidinium_carterae.1